MRLLKMGPPVTFGTQASGDDAGVSRSLAC
jgi:hypothetical protein